MQACQTVAAGSANAAGRERKGWKKMKRAGLAVLLTLLTMDVAQAQFWGSPYGRGGYYYREPPGYSWGWPWDDDYRPRRYGPRLQSGGERPAIDRLEPRTVSFPSSYPVGSIVIDSKGRQLFLIQSPTEALHYPISVGREGFSWAGTETISRKAEWPDWHPPEEMRWRDPRLPEKMTGGVKNPLGAMALYLGSSLYRIHGTNDASSIGRAASSGCFRMLNGHIVDLAARVEIGTTVQVVRRLPPELEKAVAEQVGPPTPPVAKAARRS
jgi:L,D-transpeptidase catalytic domain